jgi:hypothetical protein
MRDDGSPPTARSDASDPGAAPTADSGAGRARSRAEAGRRTRLDPEALSVAIGARQRDLAEIADRRPDVSASPPAPRARPGGGAWRRVAAAVLAAVVVGAGVAGFYRALAIVTADAPAPASGRESLLSKQERATIERLLARLDFRVGAIDGRIDPRTRAAIRRYRRYQGIPVQQGRPTPRLLDNLRAVAALAGGPAD